VGFDVLTTCQPSTVWCSRERLPAAAAQPAKVRQSCSATDKKKYHGTTVHFPSYNEDGGMLCAHPINRTSFIHSQALKIQDGPSASLFEVS
jgi:hypothetical protein